MAKAEPEPVMETCPDSQVYDPTDEEEEVLDLCHGGLEVDQRCGRRRVNWGKRPCQRARHGRSQQRMLRVLFALFLGV